MDRRKSVRFLLPMEEASHHTCGHRGLNGDRKLISPDSQCQNHHLSHHLPPRPPSREKGGVEIPEFVCSKHRKQKVLALSSGAKLSSKSKNKRLQKNGHRYYEEIDEVPSSPAEFVCRHNMRSQSASPQLSRRLVKSHPSDHSSISSKSPSHCDENVKDVLKWDHQDPKPCVHLNSEIRRQRNGVPSLNHYSDSRSLHNPLTTSSERSGNKHNHYYFLPPRDPMLTSFIESDGVIKREVMSRSSSRVFSNSSNAGQALLSNRCGLSPFFHFAFRVDPFLHNDPSLHNESVTQHIWFLTSFYTTSSRFFLFSRRLPPRLPPLDHVKAPCVQYPRSILSHPAAPRVSSIIEGGCCIFPNIHYSNNSSADGIKIHFHPGTGGGLAPNHINGYPSSPQSHATSTGTLAPSGNAITSASAPVTRRSNSQVGHSIILRCALCVFLYLIMICVDFSDNSRILL